MKELKMTWREWLTFQLPPEELILNASAMDGSDFHQAHPIGISVFAIPWLPRDLQDCRFDAAKTHLCSALFSTYTGNPGARCRDEAARDLHKMSFVAPRHISQQRLTAERFMSILLASQFTCSPRGNGFDCHRNYEAIVCKCIPLITGHDETLRAKYRKLPVVFLKRFKELSVAGLNEIWGDYYDRVFDFAPLCRSYWRVRRPDVNIDQQSEFWMRTFNCWDNWKQYVETQPSGIIVTEPKVISQ